ncbi:MAG TPA: hemolysin family protein [Thermoanaerobaculia bacterium]|nr:hemolysin family protein [Thermoanaerobaculia bacterium]
MTIVALEIALILILIAGNGVFALSEIAIVSARKSRLQSRAEAGSRRARVALKLATEPGEFLSTVQVGITMVGILTGVFGGATIAEQLGKRLDTIPLIAPHGQSVAVGIVVLAITFVTVILGELVPKRIALARAETIAALVAPTMQRISRFAKPAVWVLTRSSDVLFRLLRLPAARDESVTAEELTAMVRAGSVLGAFHPAEEIMVRGVFTLADRRADMIMRPRHKVTWLDINEPFERLQQRILEGGHQRYPVADGTLDRLVGILEIKALLPDLFKGTAPDLRNLLRQPLIVNEHASGIDVLQRFRTVANPFAVVVDEFGSIEGIITLTDLASTVLGDPSEGAITLRADGSMLVDGMMKFDDFVRHVPLARVERGGHTNLARFVLSRLGKIPAAGDWFAAGSWRFEIVEMDGRRVDKVRVSKIEPEETEETEVE